MSNSQDGADFGIQTGELAALSCEGEDVIQGASTTIDPSTAGQAHCHMKQPHLLAFHH